MLREMEELLDLDKYRGYRPSSIEREYQNWLDDLYCEAVAMEYEFVEDSGHVEFWDGDNLIDEFDFESVFHRPELTAAERNR